MHIDEFIDDPTQDAYARFVFNYFRVPAMNQSAFAPWMAQFKLFCDFNCHRFRVTGASRMGDVWLTQHYDRDCGYEHRVDVQECSKWGPARSRLLTATPEKRVQLARFEVSEDGQPMLTFPPDHEFESGFDPCCFGEELLSGLEGKELRITVEVLGPIPETS